MGFYKSKKVPTAIPRRWTTNNPEGNPNDKVTIAGRVVVSKSSEVYAAYRQKAVEVLKNDSWRGQAAFLIGGGESLRGFDYSLLKGRRTIGVNKAFLHHDCDLVYSMDVRFYKWVRDGVLDKPGEPVSQRWREFKGRKIMLAPIKLQSFAHDVYLIRRIAEKRISRDVAVGLFGGDNSGFGAMMLAILLGANPVYLLGYDMQVKTDSHWHSGYPGQDAHRTQKKVSKYAHLFNEMAPRIKAEGFDVINLGPDSALTCFPKKDIHSVL